MFGGLSLNEIGAQLSEVNTATATTILTGSCPLSNVTECIAVPAAVMDISTAYVRLVTGQNPSSSDAFFTDVKTLLEASFSEYILTVDTVVSVWSLYLAKEINIDQTDLLVFERFKRVQSAIFLAVDGILNLSGVRNASIKGLGFLYFTGKSLQASVDPQAIDTEYIDFLTAITTFWSAESSSDVSTAFNILTQYLFQPEKLLKFSLEAVPISSLIFVRVFTDAYQANVGALEGNL